MHQGDTLTMWTLVFTWLALGILCTLPALWACKRRVDGLLGRAGGFRLDSPSDVATCRRAAAFTFFASLSW